MIDKIRKGKKWLIAQSPAVLLDIHYKVKFSPIRFRSRNLRVIKQFIPNFEVIEFRFLDTQDSFSLKWGWWSRVYEYEVVLENLEKLGVREESKIHNTSWGYKGVHILFKQELDSISNQVIHSDILVSGEEKTTQWDVTDPVRVEWVEHFDFVINISTLEEIAAPHNEVIIQLMSMLRPGGHLILTFDIPGFQITMAERLLNKKIKEVKNRVSGRNSPMPMPEYSHLNVGLLILRKKH